MLQQTIGKTLQQRYKIVQNLGPSLFGHNYLGFDLQTPLYAKCIIKCLKSSPDPDELENTRLLFALEIEKLQRLDKQNGIPQLIEAFEENEHFYLVQELIRGYSLSVELPIDRSWARLWNESEAVKLLREVLGILELAHSHGIVHCDLKPDNLIRRSEDGKLFLTDFGSLGFPHEAQPPISIRRKKTTLSEYTPPEQFIHQMYPSSDIYSLGMIAIHGLTGNSPMQLDRDRETNNFIWNLNEIEVSDQVATILSKMVCHKFSERYQSAGEVLQALQNIAIEIFPEEVKSHSKHAIPVLGLAPNEHQVLNSDQHQEDISPEYEQPSRMQTGLKVSLAANALFLGVGGYLFLNNLVFHSEKNALAQATVQYQAGNLDKAIALAKSIPPESSIYPETQATIKVWFKEWKLAAQQFEIAEKAFNQSRWADVLVASHQVPNILYWQTKTDHLVRLAKPKIEVNAQKLLNKAYNSAAKKDFSTALSYLQQIPTDSSVGLVVKQKLVEYSQKQQVKAVHLLQLAYNQAEIKDFATAIKIIKQIPKETDIYPTAQIKLTEYTTKHDQQQRIAKSELKSVSNLETANYQQEVNI